MPIAAFLEAGNSRWEQGEAMSQLAFVFPKEALFRLGSRPVISGLDANVRFSPYDDCNHNRMLPIDVLPVAEQYRYITFNIGGTRNIDWSHEREWRWPYNGDMTAYNQLEEDGLISSWDEIPGLDFYNINGIGVIVKNESQADLIISDILTIVDNGRASFNTFGFVLITDLLPHTIKLQAPEETSNIISNAMIDLTPYFSLDDEECNEYTKRFSLLISEILKIPSSPISTEWGGCWLWLHDNKAPLTRALLRTGWAFVSEDGRYLVKLDDFSKKYADLQQKEEITAKLANLVEKEFGIQSCYFSVLNSNDPMKVPFYAGKPNDKISFFNCAWNAP